MGNYTLLELRPLVFHRLVQLIREAGDADAPPSVTYGHLAGDLVRVMRRPKANINPRQIGEVVGAMMDDIWKHYEEVPPINLLVVSGGTDVPGGGAGFYAEKWLGKQSGWWDAASPRQKAHAVAAVWRDAKGFPNWERVSALYQTDRVMQDFWTRKSGGIESDGKTRRACGGGPPESPEHRRLKHYIAANPKTAGANTLAQRGKIEHLFESMDEVDVAFLGNNSVQVLEVKSRISNIADLKRGVFQCVKYLHLAEAEEKITEKRPVTVRLVIESKKIPECIVDLADKLEIIILDVDPEKVERWGRKHTNWQQPTSPPSVPAST